MQNQLFHGDNLEVLREHVRTGSVALAYIDPPFHSRRDYFQSGGGPAGSAPAFTDRWAWDEDAVRGFRDLFDDPGGCQTTGSVALLRGLRDAFGENGLLAYLTSLTLRIAEIRRALAPHGTFYLHADASASHHLKLICDALFLPGGGEFRNEIVWGYESGGRGTRDFPWKHDTILRYTKSHAWTFNADAIRLPRTSTRRNHMKRGVDPDGRAYRSIKSAGKIYRYYDDKGVLPSDVWTDLSHLHQRAPERLGYPTQKPEALLERMVLASSHAGDLVLDAYCGGGTTLAAAQRLGRRWIGIDRSETAIRASRQRLADIPPAAPAATTDPTPG